MTDLGARTLTGTNTAVWSWQWTLNAVSSNHTCVGLCTQAADFNALGSSTGTGGVVFRTDGAIDVNGTNILAGGWVSMVASDVVSIYWNANTQKVWFRVNSGNWNNDPTADPANGINGVDISTFGTARLYPCAVVTGSTSDSWTANFGATSFSPSLPSGAYQGFLVTDTDVAVACRYWRVHTTAGGTLNYIALDSVEFRTSVGGPNVATTGANWFASSSWSGTYLPTNVVGAGYWCSGNSGVNQWIAYDFGESSSGWIIPAQLLLQLPNNGDWGGYPSVFNIEWSTDGLTWNVFQTLTATGWTQGSSQTFVLTDSTPLVGVQQRVSQVSTRVAATSGQQKAAQVSTRVAATSGQQKVGQASLRATYPYILPPLAPGIHRYWSIYGQSTIGRQYTAMAEISMRTSIGGSNVIGNGTAGASNFANSDNVPAYAVDGNLTTKWTSGNNERPTRWYYDFGTVVDAIPAVKEIAITSEAAGPPDPYAFQTFSLQWSDNGTDWVNFWTQSALASWGSNEQRVFNSGNVGPWATSALAGGPSIIQATGVRANGGTPSMSFDNAATAGNLILVVTSGWNQLMTLTTSGFTTFFDAHADQTNNGTQGWYKIATGGEKTFTFSGLSDWHNFVAFEFANAGTPILNAHGLASTSTNTLSVNSLVAQPSNYARLLIMEVDNNGYWTSGSFASTDPRNWFVPGQGNNHFGGFFEIPSNTSGTKTFSWSNTPINPVYADISIPGVTISRRRRQVVLFSGG